MFRGGFAWLSAVQNMSGERQWKRKEIESIPEYWSEMSRRSPGKRESLHLFFRKTLVPFIWFLRRLFAWFGDGRTRRWKFRLPCTFPPLRFICWTMIGIGAFYVFLYFSWHSPFRLQLPPRLHSLLHLLHILLLGKFYIYSRKCQNGISSLQGFIAQTRRIYNIEFELHNYCKEKRQIQKSFLKSGKS